MTKIDVFSGFLGSGKTTLIKKLVKEAYAGQKVVLIENEFGEIGIDGGFMKDAGIEITEMNSGCICCSLVGDFGKALEKVLEEINPDRILIEPSGVGKLSDVLTAIGVVDKEKAEISGVVTVVDANKFKVYSKNFGEFFFNQIESAPTIILSHVDGISEAKLADCVAKIKEKNPTAVVVTTSWDKLTGEQILTAISKTNTLAEAIDELAEAHKAKHHHHHHDDEECSCGHHHHDDDDNECGCGHHHHDDDDDDDDECECGCGHHHHDDDDDDDECECGHHHHHHDDDDDDEHECGCGHHHHHDDDDDDDEECSCGHHHHHDDDDNECGCGHHHHHHDDDEECSCGCGHHHHHHHGHDADEVFTSWGRETTRKYSVEEMTEILEDLIDESKYGIILRAKGIVEGVDGNWIHFDYVPGEPDVRTGSAEITGRLCVIGSKINEEAIAALFKA